MKFLSKLAEYFAKGLAIFSGFAPIIQQAAPQTGGVIQTVSKDLAEIGDAITDVEQIATAAASKMTGEQKLAIAAPLVADVILKSTMLANHKIADPVLFNQGVVKVAGGMADIVNSLHTDGLNNQVVNKAA